MKRMKKSLALLLVLALTLTLFSGCGGGEESSSTEDNGTASTNNDSELKLGDQKIEISMLYDDNPTYPYQEDWLAVEEIEKRTNAELEMQVVPGSDYVARRTVLFNTNEMPDIMTKTFAHDISAYVSSGMFLPISDYVDQMPNFKAFIDKYDYHEDLDNIREKDGKYYALPVNTNTERFNMHGWMMRIDLIEELGFDGPPETMDEVYEYSKAFKKVYPDAYPMTNRFGSANILSKVCQAFDTIAGWSLSNMFKYHEETNDFQFEPTSEEYKIMLQWMNKMYEEELLDVEFSTLDSTVYEERAKNGEQFIMIDWIGNEVRYNADGPTQSGNPDFNIQPIMPPKGPWGHYSGGNMPKYEQGWVINAKVAERDDFDLVLQFIDWFYTDEAAELLTFGIEGETFEVLEDGRKEYMDLSFNYTSEHGIHNNSLTVRRDDDSFASNRSQYVIDLFDEMADKGVFKPSEPSIQLSDEEKEMEGMYRPTLTDYVNQMTEKFIFGVESFDNWDQFVEACETKGVQQLDDLYNTAWEAQQ